jgi:hypothetical protein
MGRVIIPADCELTEEEIVRVAQHKTCGEINSQLTQLCKAKVGQFLLRDDLQIDEIIEAAIEENQAELEQKIREIMMEVIRRDIRVGY